MQYRGSFGSYVQSGLSGSTTCVVVVTTGGDTGCCTAAAITLELGTVAVTFLEFVITMYHLSNCRTGNSSTKLNEKHSNPNLTESQI